MITKKFKEEVLGQYLKGEIELIDARRILKISHWESAKMINEMFAGSNNEDNNFLYDKRMEEVMLQRQQRFTPQEISTQLF